jgi:hypothetical protein
MLARVIQAPRTPGRSRLARARPPRTGSAALLVCGLAAAALASGCGGGSSTTNTPAGTVSAVSYAGQVCTSVASWLKGLQTDGSNFETHVNRQTSPAQVKSLLERYLAGSLEATEAATHTLRGAGAPSVTNGHTIASTLVTEFEHANDTLRSLEAKAAGLPTHDLAALRTEAIRIGQSVRSVPIEVSTGLAALKSPALEHAAKESPSCKSVGARAK